MKNEISEIPFRAELCYSKNKGIILPENLPYLGMGSSYIATSVFKYLGINIFSELSAEYYNYLVKYRKSDNGVLISQSGKSSETLWCADHFKSFLAVVNDPESPLGQHERCSNIIDLYSGKEELLPSKTYINTLLLLYLGFGFDPGQAIQVLKSDLAYFEDIGLDIGETILKKIRWIKRKTIYIIGSGPNIATANHAALILGEASKIPVVAMPVTQYDHGHKETAKNSIIIGLNHKGPDYKRTKNILRIVRNAGGVVFELNEPKVDSIFSPITFAIPFFYTAYYLAEKLKIDSPFKVGKKVTLA